MNRNQGRVTEQKHEWRVEIQACGGGGGGISERRVDIMEQVMQII